MSKVPMDLTGRVFGRFTVLHKIGPELHGNRKKTTHLYWLCQCECGEQREVRGSALLAGLSKSCGCLRSDSISEYNLNRRNPDPWIAEMHYYVYHVKWDMENKNKNYKTWNLVVEEFKKLCQSNCFYCGSVPLGNPSTKLLKKLGVKKSGIDRRDNSKGYEFNNCVPCCTSCNKDKGAQSMCSFIEKTIQRYEYLKDQNWLQ